MLVLTRRVNQDVILEVKGVKIRVVVTKAVGEIKLGFEAPRDDVRIVRGELMEAKDDE